VLFSDGEDQGGTGGSDAVSAAATIAQNAGVHIEAVGVGTADGATVEIDGYQLHTALDTEQLTAVAQATGGTYHRASETEQLDDIASTIDLRLTVAKQDVPLAGGFIAVALALLAAGALLTGVRTGRLV
jgi:Ca-activated chloride channel homolog